MEEEDCTLVTEVNLTGMEGVPEGKGMILLTIDLDEHGVMKIKAIGKNSAFHEVGRTEEEVTIETEQSKAKVESELT